MNDPVERPQSRGEFLGNGGRKLMIFGGKGGTGKSTSAAAASLALNRRHPEKRVLLVSTDPAHSLADSLGQPVGGEVVPVCGRTNLWATEMDAVRLMEEFKERYDPIMRTLVDRGTYLDSADLDQIFSLSMPGMDEVMAVLEVSDLIQGGQYDCVVLDTAPTGHTLRLLDLPTQMLTWVKAFDTMQKKHRYLVRHYTGRYRKDEADRFLDQMNRRLKRLGALLRNPEATEFVPVTIPEPMATEETARLLASLARHKISVRSIVVNRIPWPGECPFCEHRERALKPYLEDLEARFADHRLVRIPLFPRQVRGDNALAHVGDILFGVPASSPVDFPPAPSATPVIDRGGTDVDHILELAERDLEYLFFGGKGGVGKTTMAAAAALHLARERPERRVLIFSTDPAHSLSDAFGVPIGDRITRIEATGKLEALEIDAEKLLDDVRQEYREAAQEAFHGLHRSGMDVPHDRAVLTALVDLTPSGLDELMALNRLLDLREEQPETLMILDTAPTGHLLRFLEMAGLVGQWLRAIFRILLKYRGMIRLNRVADGMLELARGIRKLQAMLTDPKRTQFVAVTIAEAMSLLETERLLSSLKRLKVSCRRVVINQVLPPTDCAFCRAKREHQGEQIRRYREPLQADCRLTFVPQFAKDIRGRDGLEELAAMVFVAPVKGSAPAVGSFP